MLGLSQAKKFRKFLVSTLVTTGLCITLALFSLATIANAQPSGDNDAGQPGSGQTANPAEEDQDTDDNVETDCAINKIGWILCPLIDVSAKIGDQSFNFLAKSFLETEPELVSDQSGTRDAWELSRNIANILFIIAFLIVILSQVTGRGLDNYGIKKTLPRLIIAAVAVNISFYICQAMVDITNIIGWEIKDFLLQLAQSVSDRTVFPPQTGPDVQTGNGFLGATAAFVLGAVAFVWFFLPLLIMGVSVVVVTCITIVLVLLLRKAIIILLVVVSPIAFVFYLLPNTEKYFQRWYTMFWKLLLVFPIVAMLFGAGQLASAIIITAGSSSTASDSYLAQVEGEEERCVELPKAEDPLSIDNEARVARCADRTGVPVMLGLVAAGVAVAPLIAVWAVMKGAIGAVGAIGGKVTGAIESYSGKALKNKGTDWAKNRAKENMNARWQRYQARGLEAGLDPNKKRSWAQAGAARLAMRKADREERLHLSKSGLERMKQRVSNEDMAHEGIESSVLKGLGEEEKERALRAARAAEEGRIQEEIKAEYLAAQDEEVHTQRDAAGKPIQAGLADLLIDALEKGTANLNSAKTAAQIKRVFEAGDAAHKASIINAVRNSGPSLAARTTSESMNADGTGYWAPGDLDAVRRGVASTSAEDMVVEAVAKGRWGAAKMAGTGGNDIGWAYNVLKNSNHADAAKARAAAYKTANEVHAVDTLRGSLKNNAPFIDSMKNNRW